MAIQPTISGTVPGQETTQNLAKLPFTGLDIVSNPTGEDTLTFNLTNNGTGPSGTLTVGAIIGTFSQVSPTEWELIAPEADIQADARTVDFHPNGAANTTVTTTFALQDTSTLFNTPSAVDTTTTVTDTVHGPTITGIIASQATTNNANIPLFAGVTVADSSNGTNTLTVTLSAVNGTLSGLGPLIGTHYTVTGTAADVTADLQGAEFHPTVGVPGSGNITPTTFTLSDTSTGAPTLPAATAATTVTNLDPTNGILFQNTDGQPSFFLTDGTTVIGGVGPVTAQSAPTVPLNPGSIWTAVGTDDFFGADRADILWQNTGTGQLTIWEMNGNNRTGGGPVDALVNPGVPLTPGPDVKVVGTGHFNGDAFTDILLQNTSTGQASIWDLNGAGSVIANGPASSNATPSVPLNPGPGWTAVGTGDFNHDGRSDILWQNSSTSQLSIWNMGGTNGTTVEHNGPVTFNGSVANPGPGWKAIGTGNFTGDGFSDDILLQNTTTGQVSVWDMGGTNGTSVVGSAAIANPGPTFKAAGSDGLGGDILLQNTGSGQTSIWHVHDLALTTHGQVSANAGSTSTAVSLTHFT